LSEIAVRFVTHDSRVGNSVRIVGIALDGPTTAPRVRNVARQLLTGPCGLPSALLGGAWCAAEIFGLPR